MSQFFKNFPIVRYSFGNNESRVLFDNLSVYVDIIDQVKDNIEYYQTYTIKDEDRPDRLSYDFYGTTEYHWTFFLVNETLKESGWPLKNTEIVDFTMQRYPNRVIISSDNISGLLKHGDRVTDKVSKVQGIVLKKNLELGQVVIKTDLNEDGTQKSLYNSAVKMNILDIERYIDGDWASVGEISYDKEVEQYNAPYNYTFNGEEVIPEISFNNVDGNEYFYIDQSQFDGGQVYETTLLEYYISENNNLKEIKVINKDVIEQVVNEYNILLGA